MIARPSSPFLSAFKEGIGQGGAGFVKPQTPGSPPRLAGLRRCAASAWPARLCRRAPHSAARSRPPRSGATRHARANRIASEQGHVLGRIVGECDRCRRNSSPLWQHFAAATPTQSVYAPISAGPQGGAYRAIAFPCAQARVARGNASVAPIGDGKRCETADQRATVLGDASCPDRGLP